MVTEDVTKERDFYRRFSDRLLLAVAEIDNEAAQDLYQKWALQFVLADTETFPPTEPFNWE